MRSPAAGQLKARRSQAAAGGSPASASQAKHSSPLVLNSKRLSKCNSLFDLNVFDVHSRGFCQTNRQGVAPMTQLEAPRRGPGGAPFRAAGFTLLELLVVVAIIGLLAA